MKTFKKVVGWIIVLGAFSIPFAGYFIELGWKPFLLGLLVVGAFVGILYLGASLIIK